MVSFVGACHPQIDAGQIVWRGHDGNDWEIFLWGDGIIQQLTDNDLNDYELHLQGGQVVGMLLMVKTQKYFFGTLVR